MDYFGGNSKGYLMPTGIVQNIFRDHYDTYRNCHSVSSREHKAASNIITCRTREQGYHVDECPNGHYKVILYNSCKHRGCPQCGLTETEIWLQRRKQQALACSYYQVVFTIDHELHIFWRWNRRLFTNLLFLAAWHSLRELLGSEKWLGAYPGVIGVFQSWGDEMQEHCHLHFIVTGGGLDKSSQWKGIDLNEILLPTKVLAAKFRGKFLAYLREGFKTHTKRNIPKPAKDILVAPAAMSVRQCLNRLNKLGRKKWHAEIEPAYEQANGVFKYVGRYIRRGPISEKRIIGYDGDRVTIAYAHAEKHEKPGFRLDTETFIQRILNHVPESGTHMVRSYGLFHPNCIDKLNKARQQLGQAPYEPMTELPHAQELLVRMFPDWKEIRCPVCGAMLRTVYVDRSGKSPPESMAA